MFFSEFETEMKNENYETFVHGIVSNTSNSGPFVQELLDDRLNFVSSKSKARPRHQG